MTPTKTKTNPAEELKQLQETAAGARQEAAELTEKVRTQREQKQELGAQLAKLARDDRGQFRDDGLPAAGSDAAKLGVAIEKLNQSQLQGVTAGAAERVAEAEDALIRHTEAHADLLSRLEYEGAGRAAVSQIQRGAALISEGFAAYTRSEHHQINICAATSGLDGQDVFSDQRALEANRVATSLVDLAAPRSRSLTPLVGEEVPRKIRAASGGFAEASHLRGEDISDDQPERVT